MNLYQQNHPKLFWRFTDELPEANWKSAFTQASPLLGFTCSETDSIEKILQLVLGEGQFGPDHWRLSLLTRLYYNFKPFFPRPLIRIMRQIYQPFAKTNFTLDWPIERRYALFMWEVVKQVMMLMGSTSLTFTSFWPDKNQYAFILTHDIETRQGQEFVRQVADLEESLGFRSLFNFVPERYAIDRSLVNELKVRGFEVGIHGLKHDGKLFSSRDEFRRRAKLINGYEKTFDSVGFRAPLTHRNPEWMQELEIEYDLSFFDTDPFEPIPGGTMSIWPFIIGHFVELPYTLIQDYTLTSIIGENSPKLWLEKVDFIEGYHGMALINSHPDYLSTRHTWDVYSKFLCAMKLRKCYWHALPCDVAKWWKKRIGLSMEIDKPNNLPLSKVFLERGTIRVEI